MRLPYASSVSRKRGKVASRLWRCGFGVVDAGQEGLGDLVERFRAETAGDEIPERLVGVAFARGDEELEAHAQLAAAAR